MQICVYRACWSDNSDSKRDFFRRLCFFPWFLRSRAVIYRTTTAWKQRTKVAARIASTLLIKMHRTALCRVVFPSFDKLLHSMLIPCLLADRYRARISGKLAFSRRSRLVDSALPQAAKKKLHTSDRFCRWADDKYTNKNCKCVVKGSRFHRAVSVTYSYSISR